MNGHQLTGWVEMKRPSFGNNGRISCFVVETLFEFATYHCNLVQNQALVIKIKPYLKAMPKLLSLTCDQSLDRKFRMYLNILMFV